MRVRTPALTHTLVPPSGWPGTVQRSSARPRAPSMTGVSSIAVPETFGVTEFRSIETPLVLPLAKWLVSVDFSPPHPVIRIIRHRRQEQIPPDSHHCQSVAHAGTPCLVVDPAQSSCRFEVRTALPLCYRGAIRYHPLAALADVARANEQSRARRTRECEAAL